ncbi:MAG: valine--tRNA ligase [Oligoflexia bacterium]|nr:valine--tRNA ligase [Oligoflexia bacterium]
MAELPKGFEPTQVENKWYQYWSDKNYFSADENSKKPSVSFVIPPPNVTGVLHMGHALNNTLQDIIVRFKRMQGFNALWIPGMDHAGIATQMVVERMLAKDGVKREQLGREKFVEKVWEWKAQSGGMILGQQKRLGLSVDWKRSRFTLDEGLSLAVRKVFVDLYNEGLIYQGNRLVNWCPRCQTAISDLEVKHSDTKGTLWHIRYPLANNAEVIVATTRPETMLGDTAIAVHPDDERYKKLVGLKVKLPLTDREIPVIKDDYVAKDFGSGIVKITPAHDFNDYEMAVRQKLPMISILDTKGVINEKGYSYKGMKVVDARKKVLEDLTALGLLVKEEPHAMSVGRCDRCETVIEPMLSDQWFVKIAPLAKPAIEVVESGKIKFTPENWKKTYLDWMYNINDWCISRQLWWGHRIPAWKCDDCKKHTVSMQDATECQFCESKNIKQDTDVLDTWFSSALWPFSTMGWPDKTKTLESFYPTTALVTGFDIIFFWVARMIMMGLHFMKDIPFKTVYIHALIRDESGQKMSKSKGNVVDPLDLVNDYGTDALRFTMASMVGAGRDIKFSEDRLDGYRNFINKIWNATRFSLTALENIKLSKDIKKEALTLPDNYIVYELEQTIKVVTQALEEYRFTDAASALYKFTWNEFCDWYLELSKPVLYGTDTEQKAQSGAVLIGVLERLVKLLHPFVPFITEEIYQLLPDHGESVMIQNYPKTDDPFFKLGSKKAADETELMKQVITAIRNIRGENRISPAIKIAARVACEDAQVLEVLKKNTAFVLSLARLEKFDLSTSGGDTKKCAVSLVVSGNLRIQVIISLEGLVDFAEEIKRLNKELEKVNKDLELTNKKLSTDTFVKNAPPEIVALEKERLEQLTDKKVQLGLGLQRLS